MSNHHFCGFHGSPVVGYVRSSRLNDAALDKMELQVRAFAQERGYNLAEVIRDEGVSLVATWKPGLERAIRGIEQGEFVGILIIDVRFLATTGRAIDRLLHRIEAAGGWVAAVSIQDERSPNRPDEN